MNEHHSLKFNVMPAAAIIGALGGIAQGAINQAIGNAANLRAQKELYNYTLPLEQGAQYNMIKMSPRLQVEGMKAAGLNPASITGGYQGSGVSGDTSANTQPLQIDAVGAAMQAAQMEMNAKMNAANVRKTNAEAQNVEKQNQWFDRVQGTELALKDAQKQLLRNQSKEIQDLLPGKVKEQTANIDILNLQKTYQEYQNEVMEREYDIDGKKVKGKDIPYFKEIFAMQMAEKTLAVDWYNAQTSRLALDRDWQSVLTKEWFAPLIRALTPKLKDMAPEIKKQIEDKIAEVQQTLDDIQNAAKNINDITSDPIGVLKNKQDLVDDKLRDNIREAGRKKGLRYDKNGNAIYNKHGLID